MDWYEGGRDSADTCSLDACGFGGQALLRSGASARSLTALNVSRLDGITRAALELNPRVRRKDAEQAGRQRFLRKVLPLRAYAESHTSAACSCPEACLSCHACQCMVHSG